MKNKKTIAIIIIIILIALIYVVEARKNAPLPADVLPATNTLGVQGGSPAAYSDLESKISAGATGNE